jgi:hypothetical protein
MRTLLFLLLPLIIWGQLHDNTWLFGYAGRANLPEYGISQLEFDQFGQFDTVKNQISEIFLTHTNASISDSLGNLLFYYNGIYIEDSSAMVMQNGDLLNPWNDTGYNLPQAGLILPWPGKQQQYVLFHNSHTWSYENEVLTPIVTVYYSLIDMDENNGKGAVIERKVPLPLDSLAYGQLTATKHANGRDWWILTRKWNSDSLYSILLSPAGIEITRQQEGPKNWEGLGQSVFSPDGSIYAMLNLADFTPQSQYVGIYYFDRCSGQLSYRHTSFLGQDAYSGGVAISSDSRYLYASHDNRIFQVDLWADDLEVSREIVAVYDGFLAPFQTRFYLTQLAPDGRIYISAPNGTRYLHVIEHPERAGVACSVNQHSLLLPTHNAFSMPNFPNFRLGPLDGSPCDTLGLDNWPVADFRPDQDTLNPLYFEFTDLSYYEPTAWAWDFGDGSTSTERYPAYNFPEPGIYEVCLTVSNAYGSHTACKEINLGVTSLKEEDDPISVQVFPNPFHQTFSLQLSDYYPHRAELGLFDALGQPVHQQRLFQGLNEVAVHHLLPGMYIYQLWDGNRLLQSGRVVKGE